MKNLRINPPQNSPDERTKGTAPTGSPRIGSSKVSTSPQINKTAPQYEGQSSEYVVYTDLFGGEKMRTAEFSAVSYCTFREQQDRLIWHPGNGLHIMRVNLGRKTYAMPRGALPSHFGTPEQLQEVLVRVPNRVPKSNRPGRYLSNPAIKEICKTFGMIHFATKKQKRTLKFVTLTLPAPQAHKDTTLKKEALNHFNLWLTRENKVSRYMWVQEAQSNGNAHFHYIVDQYINHNDLRKKWNSILDKLGYIERYRAQMSSLTFEQYCRLREPEGRTVYELRTSYEHGQLTGWNDPNTTDIKAVDSIKRAGRYMAKYVSKINMDQVTPDPDGRFPLKCRRIEGRKWARSANIKKALKSSFIDLDNQSFAIAMEAIDAAERGGAAVVREDYRIHIYGEDEHLRSIFRNLANLDSQLLTILNTCENGRKKNRDPIPDG